MSDINRNFAIRILKLMRGGIKMGLPYTQDPVEKEIEQEQLDALNYAISSLETDEAYQLEYERTTKNDLGVDCISRKAVIDAINANCIWENEYNLTSSRIKKAVENLPSVTPQEPKTGHWIPTEYDSYADGNPVWDKWECSECGYEHNGEEDTLTAYCPDCGAKMVELQESER